MPQYDTVSFLTDYGTADEFAGVVRSVIRSIAPHVAVVDITHEIEPYDVRAASLMLVRSAHYLCPGVLLAVVDPGVGTDRRAIAVEVGDGESVLVGPDNGLLAPVVALTGGASRAVELTNAEYQLQTPSPTFAGRDVFGPAAAHLANGVDLADLGTALDPATLTPAMVPFSEVRDGVLDADVLWVDRYGNVQLNVTPEQLEPFGQAVRVEAGDRRFVAHRAGTFGELTGGRAGLVVDSSGLVSIALDRESAAGRFGFAAGDALSIRPADDVAPDAQEPPGAAEQRSDGSSGGSEAQP